MTQVLCRTVGDRSLRPFLVASCEQVGHLLLDHRSRAALAVVERFAHGLAGRSELNDARRDAEAARIEAASRRDQAEERIQGISNAYWATDWEHNISVAAAAAAVAGAAAESISSSAESVVAAVAEAMNEQISQEIEDDCEMARRIALQRLAGLLREYFPSPPTGNGVRT
jgi:hypothetical protein